MTNVTDTLAEKIAQNLMRRIIRMELKSGERLIETRIAEEIGVSQSPVREALRILEKKRFVRIMPRHGTYVTELTEDFIISIYDIFQELVGLATRKTVLKRTSSDMTKIKEAFSRFEAAATSGDVFRFNDAFFNWGLECLKAAYDEILSELLIDLVPTINRIQYFSLMNRDPAELRDSIAKIALSMKYIEEGRYQEAEQNNMNNLETEKQAALAVFRQKALSNQGQ